MEQESSRADESANRRYASVVSIILPITLFLVIPAVVAKSNEIDVLSVSGWVWMRLLAVAVVGCVVLLAANFGFARNRLRGLYSALIVFLLSFVIWSGFFFPVSRDFDIGQFDAAPLNVPNILIVIALASVFTFLWFRGFARYILPAIAVFLIGNAANALVPANSVTSVRMTDRPLAASSELNLFVVSFDGLAHTHMGEVLASDERLAQALSGFTVFPNAASSSPATTASIAAELYGNRNYKLWHDTLLELRRHDPEQLFTNVLVRSGFEVSTFGNYSIENTGTTLTPSVEVDQTGLMLIQAALARSLTRFSIPRGLLAEPTDNYFTQVPELEQGDGELIRQILGSRTNAGIKEHTKTIIDYRDFVQGLEVATDQPAAFFVHFTHTHFPVEFDETCEYRADDPGWYEANQNYEGSVAEHRCAADQLRLFLQRIEELGLMDRSVIVLKGDHGKPTRYAPEGSIESDPVNGHSRFGISRYAPFLAVKPLNADRTEEVKQDDQPVLLDDLARTLCQEVEIDYDCTNYPGYNMLRDEVDPASEVTVFVVESPQSSYRFDDHVAMTFSRGQSVVQSLHDALAQSSR